MPRLVWGQIGEKKYETGVRNGVLYKSENGTYPKGVAWNGLIGVTESPSGAEATSLYADDSKYITLLSAEEFGATIEAYNCPREFYECDGQAELIEGVMIGQQDRKSFGMCYRTSIGNDTDLNAYGYKLHIFYGGVASPSEKGYESEDDSPDAITFSWEVSTTPVPVTGHKPTATVVLDSTILGPVAMAAIEDVLYGSETGEAHLPLPDEIRSIIAAAVAD